MKQFKLLASLFTIMICLTGCPDPKSEPIDKSLLIGTWKLVDVEYSNEGMGAEDHLITFYENGKALTEDLTTGKKHMDDYSIEGNKLWLYLSDEEGGADYMTIIELTSLKLILRYRFDDGSWINAIYEKVTNTPEPYIDDNRAELLCQGKWYVTIIENTTRYYNNGTYIRTESTSGNNYTKADNYWIVFNNNNTCFENGLFGGINGNLTRTWRIEGDSICILGNHNLSYGEISNADQVKFSIDRLDHDILQLTRPDGEKRQGNNVEKYYRTIIYNH